MDKNLEKRIEALERSPLNIPISPKSMEALSQGLIGVKMQRINTTLGVVNRLCLGYGTVLTIASGVITVTGSVHSIETEGGGASDDVDTINVIGEAEGMLLVLNAESASRTVVLKDTTGNLRLEGDFSMDHSRDRILLIRTGSVWFEIARSNNDT